MGDHEEAGTAEPSGRVEQRDATHEAARATLTVEEAARLLGVGRNQGYEAVRAGTIPSLRIGRRLLVPKAALDRLLAGGEPFAA